MAESHEDALESVRRQSVDLIVANLISRSAGMLQNLPELVISAAPGKVVVFGESSLGPGVRQAIAAGVHGYVPSTSRPELVAAAIGLVAAGGVYFPHMPLLDERPHCASGHDVIARLSARQRDVFQALKEGKSNKVIARELMISVATVKQHVQAILKLSGARNRTEAAALLSRQPAHTGPPAALSV
ncbi:MAG TPA: response regulator transcription factor [Phenylobacterium sp.]|nr:response regulator transcription factor [Phenylobacterium sp.]